MNRETRKTCGKKDVSETACPVQSWRHGVTQSSGIVAVFCLVLLSLVPHATAQTCDAPALTDFFPQTGHSGLLEELLPVAPVLPEGLELRYEVLPSGTENVTAFRPILKNTGKTPVQLNETPLFTTALSTQGKDDAVFPRIPTFRADDIWYESPYWDGKGWARIGRNWQHPDTDLPTVRAFRCPENGTVVITGNVFKLHQAGDGIEATIRLNTDKVWSATIEGQDGKGVDPRLTLTVERGDLIRFIVGMRGAISCDTTGWDPTITYAGGRAFTASAGFSSRQGQNGWFYEVQNGDPDTVAYLPLTYNTGKWYDSTYWQGGHLWCRVGKNWHHPGDGLPSVRCFTVPESGTITVTGNVHALHEDGDGTNAVIRHNDTEIWRQFIGGKDTKGVTPELKFAVKRGDKIRFLVDQNGSIACDTTFWDPRITYENGKTWLASEGFSSRQNANGWSYEMYQPEPPPPPRPVVRQLGRNLMPHEQAGAEQARALLPLFTVTGTAGDQGAVLGVNASGNCELRTTESDNGRRLELALIHHQPVALGPGEEIGLPIVALAPYTGRWTAGMLQFLPQGRNSTETGCLPLLSQGIEAGIRELAAGLGECGVSLPDPDLLLLVEAEWVREDGIDGSEQSLRTAIARHAEAAEKLICELRRMATSASRTVRVPANIPAVDVLPDDPGSLEDAYVQLRLFKRQLLLGHPLLDFNELFFSKRRLSRYSHLVMQYFGFRARQGGGLYVLERPGYSTGIRSIVGDQLPPGSFLEPRLSYDGRRVVFSYVECGDTELNCRTLAQNEEGEDQGYYHIYEVGVDGTGLRRLTSGYYDDLMPNYLPDGGIVFCSTRRKGYSRCFGGSFSKRWHAYTLHRVDADGSNLQILSHNDVAEWFPAVANTGHVLFARWDYIDRDAVTHQNLWAMRPDGTNQMAIWGNGTRKPHCTFQLQPVPNSKKIAFIASAHHALTGGPLCLVDPNVDANSQDAVTRITPQPYPEAESFNLPDYYEYVWPLSETLFLVSYSDQELRSEGRSQKDPTPDYALGIYVLDAAGNRELIYRDPKLNSTTPIPLRARPRPPILSPMTETESADSAEIIITDVQQGLGDLSPGTIKEIRVVQVFPKITPWANTPRIGFAGEENARAVLGAVPVEADGSARFRVPARTLILFQALDREGEAYQVMRSSTSFQPGERTSCIGCHESRMNAPPRKSSLAMLKPPRELVPGPFDGKPFNYMTAVQPIWDQHCLACHGNEKPKKIKLTGTPRDGFAESYWNLCGDPRAFDGRGTNPENAARALVPRFGQRNAIDITAPGGTFGAKGSRLLKMLRNGHGKTKLTDDELRRIAMWIDQNAIFYGAYLDDRREKQLAGNDIPMPDIQ